MRVGKGTKLLLTSLFLWPGSLREPAQYLSLTFASYLRIHPSPLVTKAVQFRQSQSCPSIIPRKVVS